MEAVFPHIDFRREVTDRPPDARHRPPRSGSAQGESADPPARGRRVPVGARCSPATSTGWSATTPAAATRPRSARRDNIWWPSPASAAPSTCCRRWSPRARSAACPYNRMAALTELEPGAALRPERQGRPSPRASTPTSRWSTRRAPGPSRAEDSPVDPGLHAVRGHRADGAGQRHLPARRGGPRRRRRRRRAAWAVRTPVGPRLALTLVSTGSLPRTRERPSGLQPPTSGWPA